MALIIENTDLFAETHAHLAHGVNTHGVMGAGIAVAFAERFDGLLDAYRTFIRQETDAGSELTGRDFAYECGDVVVHNIFSQDAPGPHARLEWLIAGLDEACASVPPGLTLHAPMIGGGIGGLNRLDVFAAFEDVARRFPYIDIVLHDYAPVSS